MGTRGFVGIVSHDRMLLAYNHYDSYPSHLGASVAEQVREAAREGALDEWRRMFDAVEVRGEMAPLTPDEFADLVHMGVIGAEEHPPHSWYDAMRESQGMLTDYLKCGYWVAADDRWPNDSLFCEWGYIVNLDAELLEVYRGFQRQSHGNGRFASRESVRSYYPVALVATLEFDDAVKEMQGLEKRLYVTGD